MKKLLLTFVAIMLGITYAAALDTTVDFGTADGLPTNDGASTVDKATLDGIEFNFYHCKKGSYSGQTYLQVTGKNKTTTPRAYVEFKCAAKATKFVITTGSNASTNVTVQLSINGTNVGNAVKLDSKSADFPFNIPAANQAAGATIRLTVTNNYNAQITKMVITTEDGGSSDLEPAGFSFKSTTFSVNVGKTLAGPTLTTAGGFDGAIVYTSEDESIATVNAETGEVTGVAAGTTKIWAKSDATATFDKGSAYYTLTVVDPNAPGATIDNPMTVAQALEVCADAPQNVYVKGIVTDIVTAWSSQYNNVTFNIADVADGTDKLQAFRAEWGSGVAHDDNEPATGATVIIFGNLKIFNSTKEFDAKCQIVKYEAPAGPVLLPAGLEFSAAEHTVNVGETVDSPELTKDTDGAVTYESANPAVATVDATTGAVTGVAAGTATITATSTATDTYKAGEASYTLTVVDPDIKYATFDFTKPAELTPAYDVTASQDISEVVFTSAEGITFSATKGTSTEARLWKKNDNTWEGRFYNGSTLTIKASEGQTITKVEFEGTVKIESVNGGNLSSKVITADEGVTTITCGANDTNNIKTITVYYEGEITKPAEAVAPTLEYDAEKHIVSVVAPVGYHIDYGWDYMGQQAQTMALAETTFTRVATYAHNITNLPELFEIPTGQQLHVVARSVDPDNETNYKEASILISNSGTTTGVDDIVSDDANAPVEYYNLQGVRVANPESGLYIRVQDKKASKVLVK